MEECRNYYNSWVGTILRSLNFEGAVNSFTTVSIVEVEYSDCTIYRLADSRTGKYVVNARGQYPYQKVIKRGDVPTKPSNKVDTPSTAEADKNKWISYTTFPTKKASFVILSLDALSDLVASLNTSGIACTLAHNDTYYFIRATNANGKGMAYYANYAGHPYVAPYAPAAANQSNNYYTETNNTTNNYDYGTTVETQIIDQSTDNSTNIGTLNLINDNDTTNNITEYNIDSLVYDESTHSYVANTYQVDYDVTNKYYTYNYYTWNIQYNITNTYVTYIGSNDAYKQEEYKYYYELPDGRSSADLTADEIAGMSFQFSDCVNYARSATDTSLRALYHFDGNTDDSGYFGTQTAFTWTQGASITYMDSSAFNGALYLDETAHKFTVTLPSALGSGDFTIQWRYYQASQADTVDNKENSFSIGTTKLFTWDERSYYFGSSTACSPVGIGTWNEVALVRHSTMLYLYINGLKVAEKSVNTPYGNEFTFTFGSTSRAYSMLDELRVVNFAVAENGTSYTPTDVPYDTNLVLVLPDSAFPIADEYYEYHLPENALTASPFNLGKVPDGMDYTALNSSNSVKLTFSSDYTTISATGSATSSLPGGFHVLRQACNITRLDKDDDSFAISGAVYPAGHYIFTVVTLDGTVYSLPIELGVGTKFFEDSYYEYSISFNYLKSDYFASSIDRISLLDCGSFYLRVQTASGSSSNYADYAYNLGASVMFDIIPKSGQFLDLIYASVIPGSAPDDAVEKVSCIYSSEEVKPNTAAIQSDIPVKGYTVGGVRPTFPQRGDVWMSVNGSRISGVQIYNGRAWESTNARYYTGTRWIPIYAFDIQTLEDCWDIADGDDVVPPITTESGFWSWWQNQWLDFRKWLELNLTGSPGSPGSPGTPGTPGSDGDGSGGFLDKILDAISDGLASLITALFDLVTKVLELVVDLVFDLLGFFFNLITETVISGIGGLIAAFTDGSLLSPFQQTVTTVDPEGNEVQTTTIGLSSGVASVFSVFSGMIMALPADLRSILIFGIAVLAFIAIFKLVKS